MHFRTEILFPVLPDNIEAAVESVMVLFRQEWDVEKEKYNDGWWDWYQIGGRWAGAHDPAYDPREDDDHMEVCSLCSGTGTRPDMECASGCNGCKGTGTALMWPTQWGQQSSDVMKLADVTDDDRSCNLIVVYDDGCKLIESETWDDELKDWVGGEYDDRTIKQQLEVMGITDGWLVTVDCHF